MNRYVSCAVCAILLAAGPLALAEQGNNSSPQKHQQPQKSAAASSSAPAPVAGVIPLGVTQIEEAAIAPGYRASKLLKQKVYNEQGQKIGRIEDLVVSPDGTLTAAVVDVGGFLGVAKHRVAIPVKQFTSLQPKITLPGATKEALKGLPEFVPA
jgi:sporulation protein YlmC with PRC-barrel domain